MRKISFFFSEEIFIFLFYYRKKNNSVSLTCTHNLCFGAKIRKYHFFFLMKFSFFYSRKNLCILHGHVFVMSTVITTEMEPLPSFTVDKVRMTPQELFARLSAEIALHSVAFCCLEIR